MPKKFNDWEVFWGSSKGKFRTCRCPSNMTREDVIDSADYGVIGRDCKCNKPLISTTEWEIEDAIKVILKPRRRK